MQMTVTDPNATIVETELVKVAETAIETESEGTAAVTRSRERYTARRMGPPQVIMAVHTEVQGAGAEAEVEMMTADAHDATEIALMRPGEMWIITEVVVACAHGLEAQTETSTAQEIAGIAMTQTLLQEKTAGTETIVARVEVHNGKAHLR